MKKANVKIVGYTDIPFRAYRYTELKDHDEWLLMWRNCPSAKIYDPGTPGSSLFLLVGDRCYRSLSIDATLGSCCQGYGLSKKEALRAFGPVVPGYGWALYTKEDGSLFYGVDDE